MRFVVEIGTEMLQAAAQDENWGILDARSSDAYIGWNHPGIERGGHIPGAGLFSSRWLTVGYPTQSGCPDKQPVSVDKDAFRFDPTQIVDIHGARQMLKHPAFGVLVDTRAWEHYIGLDSGYDYVALAGRIPGAIWCHHPYFYTCPDGTMV